MKRIIALFVLGFSLLGFSQNACDHPKNDFDGLYCMSKIWIEADKNLNEIYGKLAARLDANGKAALKKGQRAWIDSRNNTCAKSDSTGFYVNLECANNKTIERTQFLEDRYRECVSAGCMNSKL